MADAGRHPNIKILANTDVVNVEGTPGNFEVILSSKPRYVEEELCVACGTCTSFCPKTLSSPFDEGLGVQKVIDILCPQAVPASAVINREACLHFQGKCGICIPVCKSKAINFSQKRIKSKIRVGAVIVAPGCEVFDPKEESAYGFGRFKNVVTSLQLERMLNASGPSKGEVKRLSNEKIPSKIAWIQCVGSRDMRLGGNTYCSGICCTYAIKQSILVKSHYKDTQAVIFHNDIRTFGKGFEELYNRARDMGVQFVRQRVPFLREKAKDRTLVINRLYEDGNVREEEFDLVVLSLGVVTSKENKALSKIFGFSFNKDGFCEQDLLTSTAKGNDVGIYPAGAFTAPMDIPDTISSASAAAEMAAELLSSKRGSLAQTKVYPEERSVEKVEPRIGVFVCHCGTNIAGVVDVPSVVQHTLTLKSVIHAENQLIACSSEGLRRITDVINEKKLNRVVVAACTPRTHEPIFREALREAGLNPYLLAMANIREQCSWVHSFEKEEATKKAKELIIMSVNSACHLLPLKEPKLPVRNIALVLGGGLAGMTAALSIARMGFRVFLVEREKELGGHLRNIHYTLDVKEIEPILRNLIEEVQKEEKITLFEGYELYAFSGYVGNFRSTLRPVSSEGKEIALDYGAIILATGGELLRPEEYGYGTSEKVITQLDLEKMIAEEGLPKDLRQVVMIQCVGARDESHPFCGRICCGEALKNALKLKEVKRDVEVIVLFRDMRAYGFKEDYYKKAREQGVIFVKYEPERKPTVEFKDNMELAFFEPNIRRELKVTPDLLVLSTPVVGDGNQELARLLRLPLTKDGFFMEAHMKLRPVDFAMDGVFLCGMAHYPKYIQETIAQAKSAALRAATILSKEEIISSGAICEIDQERCIGCGRCVKVCPYSAIFLEERKQGKIARVITAQCKGCGTCNSVCPTDATLMHHFTSQQILSQIEALHSTPFEAKGPRILTFLCNWCGYSAADLAGGSRIQYAPNTRTVRVMCSGRVHPKFVYHALLAGYDGVLIVGCHLVDCHYISGVEQEMKVISEARKRLKEMGIEEERVRLDMASAAEAAQYVKTVEEYNGVIRSLGRMSLNDEQRQRLEELRDKQEKQFEKVRNKKG